MQKYKAVLFDLNGTKTGADVMTGLLKHPLTDKGLEQFLADHAKAAEAAR